MGILAAIQNGLSGGNSIDQVCIQMRTWSIAFNNPMADVHQTKHILSPAAYAALALKLDHASDPSIGAGEVHWAIEQATAEAREVLLQMPARQAVYSRA